MYKMYCLPVKIIKTTFWYMNRDNEVKNYGKAIKND